MSYESKMLEDLQIIYFDICDLLEEDEIDAVIFPTGSIYKNLREMLEQHKETLELYTEEK